jgi:hypothetical protein
MADAKIQYLVRQRKPEAIMPRVATFEPGTLGQIQSRTDTVEWALFWVFVVGLASVPSWYGSNLPVAWGINAVLFPGLAVIYEISLLVRGASHPVAIKTIRVSAALFVAVVILILVQDATWTPSWLHHPIWGMAADALQTSVDGSISVNRDLTTLALLRLISCVEMSRGPSDL